MLYPFMTLDDETEIVHSESYMENGKEHVRVEIEKPVEGGFESAECILPEYEWRNIQGLSSSDIEKLQELIESLAHIIIRLARNGGFENTAVQAANDYGCYRGTACGNRKFLANEIWRGDVLLLR